MNEPVLFAGLAVLAGWCFLGVLVIGLFIVLKVLQSVRTWLERIAMGVRAIEKQTEPLPREVERLAANLRAL